MRNTVNVPLTNSEYNTRPQKTKNKSTLGTITTYSHSTALTSAKVIKSSSPKPIPSASPTGGISIGSS